MFFQGNDWRSGTRYWFLKGQGSCNKYGGAGRGNMKRFLAKMEVVEGCGDGSGGGNKQW